MRAYLYEESSDFFEMKLRKRNKEIPLMQFVLPEKIFKK